MSDPTPADVQIALAAIAAGDVAEFSRQTDRFANLPLRATLPRQPHEALPVGTRVRLAPGEYRESRMPHTRHRTGTIVAAAETIVKVKWDGRHQPQSLWRGFLEAVVDGDLGRTT